MGCLKMDSPVIRIGTNQAAKIKLGTNKPATIKIGNSLGFTPADKIPDGDEVSY